MSLGGKNQYFGDYEGHDWRFQELLNELYSLNQLYQWPAQVDVY